MNLGSPIVSLVRSGSFMSAPRQPVVVKKSSIDGNGGGGGGSDDSMHEKYFKSVENTPISRRRNQSLTCANQKHSSDSSPHSPMSPKKNVSASIYIFEDLELIGNLSSFFPIDIEIGSSDGIGRHSRTISPNQI